MVEPTSWAFVYALVPFITRAVWAKVTTRLIIGHDVSHNVCY